MPTVGGVVASHASKTF